MNTEVIYKNVQIESVSLSDAAKKITHRKIAVLLDGKTMIRPVDGWVETYISALSIAKAKMIVDAVLECGGKVEGGRLVLNDGQFSELSYRSYNPHLVSLQEFQHIMNLSA